MSFIIDLHTHSRFARACSSQLNIPNLAKWAKIKGIDVLGTGDFLHPLWLAELKQDLVEDGSGFLSWKGESPSTSLRVNFVLSVEISSIYSHKGKVRRVHNIVIMPSLAAAEKLQQKLLARKANLSADGRPIIGISSKDLLAICLEVDEKAILIPAHAWTPWFGVFGSQSGYGSLAECFEDLTRYVYAIETGLSSDPLMNWRIEELDHKSIMSFSDAHSLPNLGRELTEIGGDTKDGYDGLWKAIKSPSVIPNVSEESQDSKSKVLSTIEFYPEEGKYHYTGHRNCQIKYTPEDTKRNGTTCPVCGKGLTVGVMERVEEIAVRKNQELRIMNQGGVITSQAFPERPGYRMLVPLQQVIAESFQVGTGSKKVQNEYSKLIANLGSELQILTDISISEIAKLAGAKISEGVDKVRKGELVIDPGYDGVYGVVRVWPKEEISLNPQLNLF